MKIVSSILVPALVLGLVSSEPPVDYSTTHQDSFAPPPVNGPSASYGAPISSSGSTRGHTQAVLRRPSSNYGAPGYAGRPTVTIGGSGSSYISGGSRRPSHSYGTPSDSYDDGPANYQFSYHVQDAASGNDFGHQENREGQVATGMYMVLLPDGRRQIVEYTADEHGYHPHVRYEGTAASTTGAGSGYRY